MEYVYIVKVDDRIIEKAFLAKDMARNELTKIFRKQYIFEMESVKELSKEEWKIQGETEGCTIEPGTYIKYLYWKQQNPTKLGDLEEFFIEMEDELDIAFDYIYKIMEFVLISDTTERSVYE